MRLYHFKHWPRTKSSPEWSVPNDNRIYEVHPHSCLRIARYEVFQKVYTVIRKIHWFRSSDTFQKKVTTYKYKQSNYKSTFITTNIKSYNKLWWKCAVCLPLKIDSCRVRQTLINALIYMYFGKDKESI